MGFVGSHLWDIRQVWGSKKIIYPGVFTFIRDHNGAFLAGKRTDTGMWGCVSGHMELNEKIEDAVRREVKEETGLNVSSMVCFGIASDPKYTNSLYPNGDEVHDITTLFIVGVEGNAPFVNDDEHTEWRYFAGEELAKLAGKTTDKYLEMLAEFEKTGQFQIL